MRRMQQVYERLFDHYGPQHWWPGETDFEIAVGAILTQNTAWRNVEQAIANLRDAGCLSCAAIESQSLEELAELIRPAGYFRVKARRLVNFVHFLSARYDGSLQLFFQQRLDQCRRELLEINGIGPETADSILLYAGNLPSFVVDAYTARVLKRHEWIHPEAGYYEMKDFFESQLPDDVALFNEFHALIVQVGKTHCGTRPKCEGCPLQDWLPAGGLCAEI